MKLDGRTKSYKDLCNKIAFLKNSEIIGFKKGEIISTPSSFSNYDGSYIDSGAPHKCEVLKRLIERGITEQIQARAKRKKDNGVAQLGFNPKEKKWYGWSHRAIGGFGIGDKFWEGDKESKTRKCKTLDECKQAASNFANSVS